MEGYLVPICIPVWDFSSVPAGTKRNLQLCLKHSNYKVSDYLEKKCPWSVGGRGDGGIYRGGKKELGYH